MPSIDPRSCFIRTRSSVSELMSFSRSCFLTSFRVLASSRIISLSISTDADRALWRANAAEALSDCEIMKGPTDLRMFCAAFPLSVTFASQFPISVAPTAKSVYTILLRKTVRRFASPTRKMVYSLIVADIAVIFFCQTESSLPCKHSVRLGIIAA